MTKEHDSTDTAPRTADEEGTQWDTGQLERAVDPDEKIDRLSSLLRLAMTRVRPHRVELYSRASVRARVSIEAPGQSPVVHLGFEEGIAARIALLRERCHGYAACAGADRRALGWVVEEALRSPGQTGSVEWAEDPGHPLFDREPARVLPTLSELSAWLEGAVGAAAGAGVPVRAAWVEAALTTESIAADGGLLASRERSRVWALALADGRPRILGARTVGSLDALDWARARRESLPGSLNRFPSFERPVLFLPEAAAGLVAALVRVLHSAADEPPPEIGPGWNVADDPLDPRGLVGGAFDDAGFAAARKLLWDGAEAVGRIEGAGHFRRASYRDPPVPMATTLVLGAARGEPAENCVFVESLRIHPIDSRRWVLEMSGRDPRAGAPFHDALLEVKPLDLLRRCTAALGEPRWFPRGVVTPALFFESLRN